MTAGRFSAEAAAWDNNKLIHVLSEEAWQALQRQFPNFFGDHVSPAERPYVLEIGAGTGTLTLRMAPRANRIVAIDAAEGMINALQIKLAKPENVAAARNVTAIYKLLEDPEDEVLPPADGDSGSGSGTGSAAKSPRLKFDFITSHLTLHHIPDVPGVLGTMFGCLKSGGWVALTDFEDFGPEARRFHPESKMEGVERDGIPRDWMAGLLRDAGFVDVDVKVAWRMDKMVEKFPGEFGKNAEPPSEGMGEMMEFSYLLCLGRRP
ncbi:methyltransferase domain-containing protein [Microdochium nivale]|nr:methyltransferase domain-containing protein [Microdochium nivale]